MFDWSVDEDRQLFIFARQYSFNWDLIAHVFNGANKRLKSDERLPWDCYDRWHKKFAPPAQQPLPQQILPQATQVAPGQALQAPVAGADSPVQNQSPQMPNNPNKKDRRASLAASQPPLASSPVQAGAGTPKKPEFSKAQNRHTFMVEATRKAQQRRREAQQKSSELIVASSGMYTDGSLCMNSGIPPAVRKIILSAHETHNQPFHPNLTALDLSKLKAERERAQLEEFRKREQQKLYQQAQAAAMAQQQQQQQMQVQQRSIQIPVSAVNLPCIQRSLTRQTV